MSRPRTSRLSGSFGGSLRSVASAFGTALGVKRVWPALPKPDETLASVNTAVLALRERAIVQSREAGNIRSSFVTVQDLINLGVTDEEGITAISRVVGLESLLFFEWQSLTNITNPGWNDVDNTYPVAVGSPGADQAEVSISGTAKAALYVLDFSATYIMGATNNSVQSRFSLDGGATWENFSREAKDTSDRTPFAYSFPYEHKGGGFHFVFQMKKEQANPGTLVVLFMNIWFGAKKKL